MSEFSAIEQFLLKLERNELDVFVRYPDYILLPIIPFFQLVHTENIEVVLERLSHFEQGDSQFLIRLDGFVTLVIDEANFRKDDLRHQMFQLLESMRY